MTELMKDGNAKIACYLSRELNSLNITIERSGTGGLQELDFFKLTFSGQCFFLKTIKSRKKAELKAAGLGKSEVIKFVLNKMLGKVEVNKPTSYQRVFLNRAIEKFMDSCLLRVPPYLG